MPSYSTYRITLHHQPIWVEAFYLSYHHNNKQTSTSLEPLIGLKTVTLIETFIISIIIIVKVLTHVFGLSSMSSTFPLNPICSHNKIFHITYYTSHSSIIWTLRASFFFFWDRLGNFNVHIWIYQSSRYQWCKNPVWRLTLSTQAISTK